MSPEKALSADERWRFRLALAQSMIPVPRTPGRVTIRPRKANTTRRRGLGGVIAESAAAFAFFVALIFLFHYWVELIAYLTH